jgi:hypothetical protein
MDSDYYWWTGSITASIRTRIPPDHAQRSGFSKRSSRRRLTEAFFKVSSDDSDKAIKELAKNLGKNFGEISIHYLMNFKLSI